MPERQDGVPDSVADPTTGPETQTVNPVRSLPARISFIVFGATLITSLAVTMISVRSIDDFLRGKIEQNFPTILESASRRLDLWYDQRELEIGVFASSGILADNAPLLTTKRSTRRSKRAAREVEQYLSYVLESFPQYEALFVLGPRGERLLWAGTDFDLSDELLRDKLAGIVDTRLGPTVDVGDELIQLTSAPLSGAGSQPVGSLHAVMRVEAAAEALSTDEVGEFGEVFLTDASRRYLVASPERMSTGTWTAPELSNESEHALLDYSNYGGERVVGSARPFSRFGWTLAVEEPYNDAFGPVVSGIRRILGINLGIVLLFALAAFRVARSIVQPIEALSETARRISAGGRSVELPHSERRDEVGVLTRAFNAMTHRLESNAEKMRGQNLELQRMNEILEQLSITDGLTKLHNHRYFQEQLAKDMKRALRTDEPLSLILIDIDHFKKWNDRLGHSGGDEILRRIAEIMQGLTRDTDLVARYGGEEFALVLRGTPIEGAVGLAEKIRASIAETRFVEAETEPLTVSIGVSTFGGDETAFFDQADRALYRAKHAGRDCVMLPEKAEPAAV
jgi:diguanylate cyclase (GGDEF)-like protein